MNFRSLYLAAYPLVLIDETAQSSILITYLPSQINDSGCQHQHDDNHGGGKGYGENEFNIHNSQWMISTAKVWRLQKTVVSPQENFVPNREKKDFRYL